MENKDNSKNKSSLISLLAILLFMVGLFFAVGGILFPKGDLQAIGLGVELQIFGLAIIVLNKKQTGQ
jgi:hypothetical protein